MTYLPIASYGIIGNLGSCALVSKHGSIDWCCLPRLDTPSIFAQLLDPDIGGYWSVDVSDIQSSQQQYVKDTNILQTTIIAKTGTLVLSDWMPMGPYGNHTQEAHREPAVYRWLQCTQGDVEAQITFNPRCNYARGQTILTQTDTGIDAKGTEDTLTLVAPCTFVIDSKGAHATTHLATGQSLTMICTYGHSEKRTHLSAPESFAQTDTYWKTWLQEDRISVPILKRWRKEVERSSLVLKILSGSGHGIAAAPTTSLPEHIGGSDNWDYRYNWLRDSSFTLQAMSSLGHIDDAHRFFRWIAHLLQSSGRRPVDLQVLYPLNGDSLIAEEELTHLRGYKDSKPVRIGNAAKDQKQIDIYGEILNAVYHSERLHLSETSKLASALVDIVEYVCDIWREPDHGIWELRTDPQQFTYSKVMCWVALDRGILLAEKHKWKVDISRWKSERDILKQMVMDHGFDIKKRCFMQSFGSSIIDATALLFPILGFIPADHPYALSTLDTIQRKLTMQGSLVYRSDAHIGKEGAFGLCCFWLVDALAFAGRITEAEEVFQDLLRRTNHVGLYAEEIEPVTGEFLGNFPQAFTHVGLINSALYLERAKKIQR